MSPGDLEIAMQFGTVLEGVARTGDRAGVYPLLAADIEWFTPRRTLSGVEELKHDRIWGDPPEHLDLGFKVGDWADLGGGRSAVDVRQIYRMKGSGDFAYQRDLHIEVMIRGGKIARYEIRPTP